MRVRAIAVLSVVVAACWAGPSGAATPDQSWTLTATGSRSAPLQLSATVELRLTESVDEIAEGRRTIDSVVRMDGRYGGMVIRTPSGAVVAGVLRHRDAATLTVWGQYDDASRQILAPGRYTVTVFGDRTTRVMLATASGVRRTIVARNPAKVTVTGARDSDDLHRTLPAADLIAPITIRPSSAYVVLASFAGPTPATGAATLCINPPSSAGCTDYEHMRAGGTGCGVCVDRAEDWALMAPPGVIPSGRYVARFTVAEAGLHDHHSLFTAVFD